MTTATRADNFDVDSDARLIERFIVEVDGIAEFERLRSGGWETPTVRHIDAALTEFVRATLGDLIDEEVEKLHDRSEERGRELFREFSRAMVGEDVRSSGEGGGE